MPELSRVAEAEGKIIGCIMYSKACVIDGDKKTEILTFGPLCVDPEYQGRHVGRLLLQETMRLAAEMGFRAIIIFGEPDYYPLLGFRTCDNFGITTPDGANFPAFMGIELIPGGLDGVHGKFYEAEAFSVESLPPEEADDYDKRFPYMPKQKFPKQWA
jgi:Predicted acetyltransferase